MRRGGGGANLRNVSAGNLFQDSQAQLQQPLWKSQLFLWTHAQLLNSPTVFSDLVAHTIPTALWCSGYSVMHFPSNQDDRLGGIGVVLLWN